MYSFLSKNGQYIALGIGAFITIVFAIFIAGGSSTFSALDAENLSMREYNAKLSETSIFDFGIYASLALVIITAVACVVFGVLGIAKNFKAAKKGLIGFGVLLVIAIIGYAIAGSMGDGESTLAVIDKMNAKAVDAEGKPGMEYITSNISSWVSGGLVTMLILVIVAFLGIIISEVYNLFR